jgi:hypothetical protein
MTRRLIRAAAIAAFAATAYFSEAHASSEGGCYPAFPSLTSKFMCRDVSAALIPENDTRDNLIFLMSDRQGKPFTAWPEEPAGDGSGGSYGYGTVCVSDGSGGVGFQSALAADASIPADEKKALSEARMALSCDGNTAAPAVTAQSEAGKAFAAYLAASDYFYRNSHFNSTAFDALVTSSQPWVKEAARYMQARIALLQVQATAFDEWGSIDRRFINPDLVSKARESLNAYLKDYPNGAYAASAKGLLRRADWFGGDAKTLAVTYSRLVATSELNNTSIMLAHEVDQKLPGEAYTDAASDPILLAVQLLREMREESTGADTTAYVMKAERLEQYRARFAGQEALFDYLLALRAFLVDKDADTVLRLLADEPPEGPETYLTFSQQMLRGAALDAKGDASARDLYLAMLPRAQNLYQRGTVEMAIAKYEERHKNMSFLFEEGSPLQNTDIRIRLLDQVAGPIILKMQATSEKAPKAERDAALYRLLVRDLTHGRFKGFLSDVKLLPEAAKTAPDNYEDKDFSVFFWAGGTDDGYTCPGITAIAETLAAKPNDVQGRLCLGEFFRIHSIMPTDPVDKDELGGTGTLFAGKLQHREDFYRDIMKDPKARRADRAYALYRAIYCYQGTNTCGRDDVDEAGRKAWFKELKAKYADTDWGRDIRYYW